VTTDRRAAIAAYKERKKIAGIFVIRCKASPETWVGQAPDLMKIRNRIWFTLRHGSHRCQSLQTAWNAHGPENLALEECERLEDEETPYTPYIKDALLKERMLHWQSRLGAEAI
jgi:hypothetical protein